MASMAYERKRNTGMNYQDKAENSFWDHVVDAGTHLKLLIPEWDVAFCLLHKRRVGSWELRGKLIIDLKIKKLMLPKIFLLVCPRSAFIRHSPLIVFVSCHSTQE